MVAKMVGLGSQYAMITQGSNSDAFDGAKTYELKIPANLPAKDFWSIVVYDPQTRSELQTSSPFPSKNSETRNMVANVDGSIDIYLAPEAPKGKENSWIETVPQKYWIPLLRLYSPL